MKHLPAGAHWWIGAALLAPLLWLGAVVYAATTIDHTPRVVDAIDVTDHPAP